MWARRANKGDASGSQPLGSRSPKARDRVQPQLDSASTSGPPASVEVTQKHEWITGEQNCMFTNYQPQIDALAEAVASTNNAQNVLSEELFKLIEGLGETDRSLLNSITTSVDAVAATLIEIKERLDKLEGH